jgi:hypothetical protein
MRREARRCRKGIRGGSADARLVIRVKPTLALSCVLVLVALAPGAAASHPSVAGPQCFVHTGIFVIDAALAASCRIQVCTSGAHGMSQFLACLT